MSRHFIQLVQSGETHDIAEMVRETPSLVHARDEHGVSALLWSIYAHRPVVRDFLLARIEYLDLHEAAATGALAALRAALERDPSKVWEVSPDGWPPLHLAAGFGGPSAVRILVQHGAHVHQQSRNAMRNQAIHACLALGRDPETLRVLLDHGADPNSPQPGGITPLHQAAACGRTDLIEMLLDAGARLDAKTDDGRTALDLARERHRSDATTLLESRMKQSETAQA